MEMLVQQRLSSKNITTNCAANKVTPPAVIHPPRVSQCNTSKKGRRARKTAASALGRETKGYLGARARTTAYRTASYKPTLEKFSSVSFSNYVRRVLLGVPIEGVEGEDPYFSSCSTDEEGDDAARKTPAHGSSTQATQINLAISDNDAEGNSKNNVLRGGKRNFCRAVSPTASDNESSLEKSNITGNKAGTTGTSPGNELPASARSETPQPQPIPPTTNNPKMTTRSQTRSSTRRAAAATNATKPPKVTNIYEKFYRRPPSPPPVAAPPPPVASPPPTLQKRRRKITPPRLSPDELKMSDGLAKITPPVGWWDKAGIGKDTSGRGPVWEEGGSMGDMVIPGPIKQCASGIGGVYDFTMMELPPMTVAQLRKKADAYRKRQIGAEVDDNVGNKTMDELARKFWRRLGPTMEPPIYGADMEGTLFDGAKACGWNIDRLESCLQLLRAEHCNGTGSDDHFRLPGVTSAYLYFGMWASVFAAHTEDMNLASINYLHAGAPKYWYAVSPEDSDRFESLMASQFSSASSSCPQFLRHKSHLLSPSILTKAGISYTTQVQRAGDIIITFPGSYHFGLNTGFNCAESTNFAFPEWIPWGAKAKVCMCHPHSVRIDMKRFQELHDRYEMETSYNDGPSMTYDEWAKREVKRKQRVVKDEKTTQNNDESDKQVISKKNVKKRSRPRSKVVEVVKMLRHRKTMDIVLPTKNATKQATGKLDWRLALNAKKSAFCPQTKVLCLVQSNDLKNVYFSGVISCVVDDHARIHFAGSSKNEDIWIETNSCQLYLDGGSSEPTQGKTNKRSTNKRRKRG